MKLSWVLRVGTVAFVCAATCAATLVGVSLPARAVASLQNFVIVSAGSYTNCAVDTDGVAWCWGSGFYGQLGNGGTADSRVPVRVSGGNTWASVSAGFGTSCGVTTSGEAWCWGSGSHGELGNGGTANSSVPVRVSGGNTWASVSVGIWTSCGVTTSGEAWCWGSGDSGELGNGGTANSSVPVRVSGGNTWASVSLGGLAPSNSSTVCGVTTSGEAWCWGSGVYGQLGNGGTADSSVPVRAGSLTNVMSISVGSNCAIALVGSSSTAQVMAWGSNDRGRLGAGPATVSSSTPIVSGLPDAPISVSGASGVGQVAVTWSAPVFTGWTAITGYTVTSNPAGGSCSTTGALTCTVTGLTNGTAYTFTVTATNSAGSSVASVQSAAVAVVPIRNSGGRISAGAGSNCLVDGNGEAWCWGSGRSGALGNGGTADSSVPVRVSGGNTWASV
ncbi:MAG: RCC1 domain-containing protein, partial [Actinomycetes bacterium]